MTEHAASQESQAFSITQYAGLLVVGIVFVSSLLLGNSAYKKHQDFLLNERLQAERSIENVSQQIQDYINRETLLLQVFLQANRHAIVDTLKDAAPAQNTELWRELRKTFPNIHNFTFSDRNGDTLLQDPDGIVTRSCQNDLRFFAKQHYPRELSVHQVTHGRGEHIDLFTEVSGDQSDPAKVFMISLGLPQLLDILDKGSIPGHELQLINPKQERVELSSTNHPLDRHIRNLQQRDMENVLAKLKVPDTRWLLQDTAPVRRYSEHSSALLNKTLSTVLSLFVIAALLLWIIRREENRRLVAEKALRKASDELEEQVSVRTEELMESRTELEYLVAHDPLTGLLNRREFERQIEHTLQDAHTNYVQSALCYVDLDQFKVVNDTAGHAAGDELLRQLCNILQNQVRKGDTLARLGGDEFGVILHSCSSENAMSIADKLRSEVREFKFSWQGMQFEVGASIGVVPITPEAENIQVLMTAADSACYTAKELGRNQVHLYRPGAGNIVESTALMKRSQDVTRARQEGRLILYCQPIRYIGTTAKASLSHETLIRMYTPQGVLEKPEEFLHAAERFGHMTELDLWVTREALNWLADAPEQYRLNVNLSGQTLSHPQGLQNFEELLDHFKEVQTRICFEITETAAVGSFTQARNFISTLRNRGCRFALDNYGSGVCSFSYLRNLPVDSLKIDGEIIKAIVKDPVSVAMVSSISRMAKAMNLVCIAEYIEDAQLLAQIQAMGIEYGQGYYFGEPIPLKNLLKG